MPRMSSRTRPRVAPNYSIIKRTSHSVYSFLNSYKNGVKLSLTCMPAAQGYIQTSRFAGARGARGAPLTDVSYALALSLALSIGGVLGDDALRRSFNPAGVLPSCLSDWGRDVLLLLLTPG